MSRIRYLPVTVHALRRRLAWDLDASPLPHGLKPATTRYAPGLVDVDVFPELEAHCDPREIELRADGAWRFKAGT